MTIETSTPSTLNLWQLRIVITGWITYAVYYLGRSNISPALPDLQASLQLSKRDVGLIVTGFFWAYALGQLINGRLGDRLSPRRFVLVGMSVSAILNFSFGTFST